MPLWPTALKSSLLSKCRLWMAGNSQKCNSARCRKTKLTPKKSDESGPGVECPICYEFKWKLSMLKNCDHVFCSDCLERWSQENETLECPFCRKKSAMTVSSRLRFSGTEREELFAEHVTCVLSSDPILKKLHSCLNEQWRSLLEAMLLCSIPGSYEGLNSHMIKSYALTNGLKVCRVGKHHVSFRDKHGTATRILLVCKMEEMYWQLVVDSGMFDDDEEEVGGCRYDDLHADRMINSFRRLVVEAPAKIPIRLSPREDMFFVLRDFRGATCKFFLRLKPRSRFSHTVTRREKRRTPDSLRNLRRHNVLAEGYSTSLRFYRKYVHLVAWEIFNGPR